MSYMSNTEVMRLRKLNRHTSRTIHCIRLEPGETVEDDILTLWLYHQEIIPLIVDSAD